MSCIVWVGCVKGRDFSKVKQAGMDPRQFFDVDTSKRFIEFHSSQDPTPLYAIVAAEPNAWFVLQDPIVKRAVEQHQSIGLYCTDDNAISVGRRGQFSVPENATYVPAGCLQERLAAKYTEEMTNADASNSNSAGIDTTVFGSMKALVVPPPPGIPSEARFLGEGPSGSVWRLDSAIPGGAPIAIRVPAAGDEANTSDYVAAVEAQRKVIHPKISCATKLEYDKSTGKLLAVYSNAFHVHIERNYRDEIVPECVAIRALTNILQALAFAHEHGIIARSLSTYQVVFDYDNEIRLSTTYFVPESRPTILFKWRILTYLAPESAAADCYTRASDLWGFGCIALRFVSGLSPWSSLKHDSPAILARLKQIYETKDASLVMEHMLSRIPPGTNPSLKALIIQCLSIDPAQRPTAAELLDDPLFSTQVLAGPSQTEDQELDNCVFTLHPLHYRSVQFNQVRDQLERALLKQTEGIYLELIGATRVQNDILRKRFNMKLSLLGSPTAAFAPALQNAQQVLRRGLLRPGHRLMTFSPQDSGRRSTRSGISVYLYPADAAKAGSSDPLELHGIVEVLLFDVALGKTSVASPSEWRGRESRLAEYDSVVDDSHIVVFHEAQLCPTFVLRCRVRSSSIQLSVPSTYIVLKRELGHGSFGEVKLAMQLPRGIPVAVKIFRVQSTAHEARAEFEMLKQLREFKHIMKVYHFEVRGDTAYMFMELLAASVLDLIRGAGPMREEIARHYMQQAAAGLDSLRLEGVVHRDVKPANMMLGFDGTLKLTDFGLSTAVSSKGVGGMVGSPAYWAPELVALAGTEHSHETDVWALAASVVHMLSGSPPYSELGSNIPWETLVYMIGVQKTAPNIPVCSVGLAKLLDRCFARDPSQRPSVQELASPATYEMPLDAASSESITFANDSGAFAPDEAVFHEALAETYWAQSRTPGATLAIDSNESPEFIRSRPTALSGSFETPI